MNHTKSGATLAEMCIVIAIVAIVATMIVSFSSLTQMHFRIDEGQYEAVEALSAARNSIRDFLLCYDRADCTIRAEQDGFSVQQGGDTVARLTFDFRRHNLTLQQDGDTQTLHLWEKLSALSVTTEQQGSRTLVSCVFSYGQVTSALGEEQKTLESLLLTSAAGWEADHAE